MSDIILYILCSSQCQCEVDRYQDTLRLLKDYYQGMEGKIPEELDANFARIPLIDLPPLERPGSGIPQAESAVPSESQTQVVTPTPTTPSAKGKKGKGEVVEEPKEGEEEPKPKLVSYPSIYNVQMPHQHRYLIHHAVPQGTVVPWGTALSSAILHSPEVKSCRIIWCVVQREHIVKNLVIYLVLSTSKEF